MPMSSRRNKFQLPPLLWRAPKFSNLTLIQKSALSSPFKLPIHELLVPPSARRRVRIRYIDFICIAALKLTAVSRYWSHIDAVGHLQLDRVPADRCCSALLLHVADGFVTLSEGPTQSNFITKKSC